MDRRDFLLFKTQGRLQVAVLSCQELYVRSVDARFPAAGAPEQVDPLESGEPPSVFAPQTSEELFASLEGDLLRADVVRVEDTVWLDSLGSEWKLGLEGLLASVRARGARVELVEASSLGGAAPARTG